LKITRCLIQRQRPERPVIVSDVGSPTAADGPAPAAADGPAPVAADGRQSLCVAAPPAAAKAHFGAAERRGLGGCLRAHPAATTTDGRRAGADRAAVPTGQVLARQHGVRCEQPFCVATPPATAAAHVGAAKHRGLGGCLRASPTPAAADGRRAGANRAAAAAKQGVRCQQPFCVAAPPAAAAALVCAAKHRGLSGCHRAHPATTITDGRRAGADRAAVPTGQVLAHERGIRCQQPLCVAAHPAAAAAHVGAAKRRGHGGCHRAHPAATTADGRRAGAECAAAPTGQVFARQRGVRCQQLLCVATHAATAAAHVSAAERRGLGG
ncbi:hypothetical protein T492DRAFT_1130173, partial [Pavlovales sp. CCMP2436]